MGGVRGICRNTEARIFLLEALVVGYSFTAAAFRSNRPSIPNDPWALARLAIPSMAALFGLLLRDAYRDPGDRPPHASALDVIVAYGLAFLSEVVLGIFKPELVLPRWAPTQGGFVGICLVVATRSLFPPRPQLPRDVATISLVGIRWKAEELGKSIGRSTKAYLAASALFSSMALYFLVSGSPKARIASCFILAGAVYLIYQIRERGFSAAVHTDPGLTTPLESYRRGLERQRAFLQRASYWYYGSLLPGVIISLRGSMVYLYWLPLVVLLAAELNHRAEQKLQQELNDLNASEALKPPSPIV